MRETASGPEPVRCSALARALDEPLAGSAPHAPRWVCLEHSGPWPRDVTVHPDPAVRMLANRATAAGWRLLLIRRPGRQPGAAGSASPPGRVYLTDTTPPGPHTVALTASGSAELAALPLPGRDASLPGVPVTEPLLMVCTHGRRDRCCALDGRALVLALAAAGEPGIWECSHLGGHRFAPTALVLPTGYLYGRLEPDSAIAARKAAGHGEVEVALSRGRSTWAAAGQVAELAVRAATGLRDAADLTVAPATAAEVLVSAADGHRWAVEVRPVELRGKRPPSCGARPEPFAPLRAVGIRVVA